MRTIELLSPAKNLECGLAAINHGADAVYIGAPMFSARAAAGNSLADIEQLIPGGAAESSGQVQTQDKIISVAVLGYYKR